jgi:hypothetical protein
MPKRTKRVSAEMKDAAAALGQRGGQARARNLSAKERKESARQAAITRWETVRAKEKEPKLPLGSQLHPDWIAKQK